MLRIVDGFYHHEPPYMLGEIIEIPNLYNRPIGFILEHINEKGAVWYWVNAGDSVKLHVGDKIRPTGFDAARKGLEQYLWVVQDNWRLRYELSPPVAPS